MPSSPTEGRPPAVMFLAIAISCLALSTSRPVKGAPYLERWHSCDVAGGTVIF
jgi:hypothetical protein